MNFRLRLLVIRGLTGFVLISGVLFMACAQKTSTESAIENTSESQSKLLETSENPSLFTSSDMGLSWRKVSNLPSNTQVSFMDTIAGKLIIATDNKGLFISNDDHTDFQKISQMLPSEKINALYVEGSDIYIGVFQKGIFHTNTMGLSWTDLNYDLNDKRVQSIIRHNNNLLVATDSGISMLHEKTKKWTSMFDERQVVNIRRVSDHLIAGSSDGLLKSIDDGNNWIWINKEGAVHNLAEWRIEFTQ